MHHEAERLKRELLALREKMNAASPRQVETVIPGPGNPDYSWSLEWAAQWNGDGLGYALRVHAPESWEMFTPSQFPLLARMYEVGAALERWRKNEGPWPLAKDAA